MRNVSKLFQQTMQERTDFYAVAQITFADGTQKTLGKEDFNLSGNYISQGGGTTSFPLGVFVAKRIEISLMNDDDRWSDYDFALAQIFLQTKFDLDNGSTEPLNIGTFTVITPESYGTTITITAMDDSYRTDREYDTKMTYPMSLGIALRDSCQTCGITLLTQSFANSNYVIQEKPEGITHRQFIGMCAMIAGGNAMMDEYNRLKIVSYDFSPFEAPGLDGGIFDSASPYATGDKADGGSFNPWNTGYVYDGGQFGDRNNIHVLYQFKSGMTIEVDDVVITGVQITSTDDDNNTIAHLFGSEGYVLALENNLASGKEDEAVALIGEKIVGLRFRPFSGQHIALPTAEFMDLAMVIDWKQNVYKTVITDVEFNYFGYTSLKCAADSPIRNSSTYNGNATRAIVQARQMVEREKTDRERAIENLANQLERSSGLFMTAELQPDGSYIYYAHDKPTLKESMIVWKFTAEAIGISTDGGKTYPYGLDVGGIAILNKIYAIGIDADYITTGAFQIIKNGKIMVLMDKDTGQVILRPDIFEVKTKYFAVNGDDGAMYSNSPVVIGPLMMTSIVSSSLDTSYADSIKAHVMSVSFRGNQKYSLLFGEDASGTYPANYQVNQIHIYASDGTTFETGNVVVRNNFNVYGTKNRIVDTENHAKRLQYCYEMSSPMFGDIGEAITDDAGECYIYLDDIFAETVSAYIEYQVLLQKEAKGDIWIAEKTQQYFVVKGTPRLKFAWEIKAKQKDYEYERLESYNPDDNTGEIDYESQYIMEIEELLNRQEELLYETA